MPALRSSPPPKPGFGQEGKTTGRLSWCLLPVRGQHSRLLLDDHVPLARSLAGQERQVSPDPALCSLRAGQPESYFINPHSGPGRKTPVPTCNPPVPWEGVSSKHAPLALHCPALQPPVGGWLESGGGGTAAPRHPHHTMQRQKQDPHESQNSGSNSTWPLSTCVPLAETRSSAPPKPHPSNLRGS